MFLVFGSLTLFYQTIKIKVSNNVKTNNVSRASERFKFKRPISVLKIKQTPIG